MSNPKEPSASANTRRKALKAVGAGGLLAGTLPSSWTTPIVNKVLLPVHAQTSPVEEPPDSPDPCGGGGPCEAGMSVDIISAVVTGGGGLFVLGDATIPGSCTTGDPDDASLLCEVIDEGSVIGSESRSTASTDCADATATGCLVSCSVVVDSGSNTLLTGDCVTLRITYNGSCVCSDVATVA